MSSSASPSPDCLYNHFKILSQPVEIDYFDHSLEIEAKTTLENYDNGKTKHNSENDLALSILNASFTSLEIENTVKKLKTGKSAGKDMIPAEFMKYCGTDLYSDLSNVFNYMIENKHFPDSWAEGIRSAIHKAGDKLNPSNYRGITVLPIFTKIFESTVRDRLIFVNEAFDLLDKNNGGFLKGNISSDKLFIPNSLFQK